MTDDRPALDATTLDRPDLIAYVEALRAENSDMRAATNYWGDQARAAFARIDAALALGERDGYTTWDRDERLGDSPWDLEAIERWEAVHGHDPRLKCFAEYGCQLLIDPADLRAALEAKP